MAPSILRVLGHDLRWQLAAYLRASDLTVGELTAATGEAQNLVSYHLRVLRDAGLVRERRSSADGRDIYYSLDRRAVTAGLLAASEAISPGVQPQLSGGSQETPWVGRLASVLFLCTGNSARSQIAEAMLRELGGRHVLVRSAGTHPVGVHPQVAVVLASRNVRAGSLRSKSVTELGDVAFDYVVSLCDIARTEPVEVSGKPRLVHWSVPDPVTTRGNQKTVAMAFERAANEIQVRVQDFYSDLRNQTSAA